MSQSRFVRTENNVFYLQHLSVPTPVVTPEVTHHILVVDRSGSMWGDIEQLKQSLEQALAVESFTNEAVLTTLISFSSHGDLTLHWSKVPAEKVMELSGPYLKEIRGIRATYLTGMSQGLNLALEQVNPTQTTGITLFTDGYPNHPSSYSENQSIDRFVAKAGEIPSLFLNCIGYRDWCDWPRLNAMSNALSGKTVKARSFRDVLDAMKDTQTLLSGSMRPAVKVDAVPGTMLMAVNRTTGQVNSTLGDLTLRGLGESAQMDIYAVQKAEATYSIPKGVRVIPTEEASLFGALCTAYTSMQDLRTAKDLLFASGNKTLWEEHQSAMTPSSLSAMLSDLSLWVQAGNNTNYEMGRNVRPKFNLFDLALAINSLPPQSIGVATEEFYASYRRRSLKRVPGKREEDGTVIPPAAELVARTGSHVYVRGLSFNTSDASVQLETVRKMGLKNLATGEVVDEVKFVDVTGLKEFRTYTLISSGERNVETIPLEVYTQLGWESLCPFLIPSEVAKGFKPGGKIRIPLKKFRMDTDSAPSTEELMSAFYTRLHAEVQVKALSAMQDKGAASSYSPEQVEALKGLHLTQALYFSPPTMYPFVDREEAIAKGEIDSFTRYKVNFGSTDILNSGAFKSGNAFLARRYAVTTADGTPMPKPKLDGYLQGDQYSLKGGKGKDTAADILMAEAFDKILLTPERMSNGEIVALLGNQKAVVQKANDLFQSLVMEIGCTGLLPASLDAVTTRYEPEAFAAKFNVKLKKAETEGLFFVADNGLVISIVPETSWYTVAVAA